MYIDDIQWTLNHARGEYELHLHNLDRNRIVTIEMTPMQLHSLAARLQQSFESDFPRAEPPGFKRKATLDEKPGPDSELYEN